MWGQCFERNRGGGPIAYGKGQWAKHWKSTNEKHSIHEREAKILGGKPRGKGEKWATAERREQQWERKKESIHFQANYNDSNVRSCHAGFQVRNGRILFFQLIGSWSFKGILFVKMKILDLIYGVCDGNWKLPADYLIKSFFDLIDH